MAQILHGMPVQTHILSQLKPRIQHLRRPPGLAVVLVGHNPASEIYVRSKIKASAELGIFSETLTPPESITTEELIAIVDELNHRTDIDGILVQMPLPKHVDARAVRLLPTQA
jgi:methylenetetrahydrofolate dehydrogenase (NADP+)/methenyltetrahydrofolate cyclohydrolase